MSEAFDPSGQFGRLTALDKAAVGALFVVDIAAVVGFFALIYYGLQSLG